VTELPLRRQRASRVEVELRCHARHNVELVLREPSEERDRRESYVVHAPTISVLCVAIWSPSGKEVGVAARTFLQTVRARCLDVFEHAARLPVAALR